MIGPSERPSRLPREKRKALESKEPKDNGVQVGRERSALRSLFAAKIAAAYLYAPKHDVAALIASLRAEEAAAVNALRRQRTVRRRVTPKWAAAAKTVTGQVKLQRPVRKRRRCRQQSIRPWRSI